MLKALRQTRFKEVEKRCKECGARLILANTRDLERKNFCSRVCVATHFGKQRDMRPIYQKASTPEANAKKGFKKEKHPLWIPDRSLIKGRIKSDQKDWRMAVFERDKFKCSECGQIGGELQAHHKAPHSLFKFLRDNVSNGMTVCKQCHKNIHDAAAELFGGLTSKKFKGSYFAS